jgi:hypothetical protein
MAWHPLYNLIRRRYGLRFLYLHFLITAGKCPFTGFRGEGLSPADFTFIAFSQFTGHDYPPSLLFQFHRLIAAGNGAVAASGDNDLSAALGAYISLSHCICHRVPPYDGFL